MNWNNGKKWVTAALAVLIGFNLVACGGGGGGDDDDDGGSNDGSAAIAPESIGGNEFTFYSGTLGTRTVAFNTDNATWSEVRDGATVTGSYQYIRASTPNGAQIVLNDQGQDQAIILNFNSQNTGAFAFRDQRDNGTFEMRASNNGEGNEIPPNGGLAASSLAGKTMYGTRTYTSTGPVGQTHTYTFSVNTFHDSDPPEESDGSYLYTPNGNDATLDLSYHSPAGFNGDKHALNMTFHTETAGVFDSTYTRRDGTVIQINGTFRIE